MALGLLGILAISGLSKLDLVIVESLSLSFEVVLSLGEVFSVSVQALVEAGINVEDFSNEIVVFSVRVGLVLLVVSETGVNRSSELFELIENAAESVLVQRGGQSDEAGDGVGFTDLGELGKNGRLGGSD